MPTRSAIPRPVASIRLAAIAAILASFGTSALAGDEDLSPNAYQEFDPVTGFMVTVDPDADSGHGDDSAAQADQDGMHAAGNPTGEPDPEPPTWLYWVIVGVAGVGIVAWLRGRAALLAD